jgi:hypothetical protein
MAFWKRKSRLFANLRVGKPDVEPSKPSHIRGIRQGNKPRAHAREPAIEPGIEESGPGMARSTALRSTGIRAKHRNPIDPRMPNLSPP